jgi:hypothetical protein
MNHHRPWTGTLLLLRIRALPPMLRASRMSLVEGYRIADRFILQLAMEKRRRR